MEKAEDGRWLSILELIKRMLLHDASVELLLNHRAALNKKFPLHSLRGSYFLDT